MQNEGAFQILKRGEVGERHKETSNPGSDSEGTRPVYAGQCRHAWHRNNGIRFIA